MKQPVPIKTLITRTPIRINDLGGWTDTWFSKTGAVLNVAVQPGIELEARLFENKEKRRERIMVHAVNRDLLFSFDPDHPSMEPEPLIQAALTLLPMPEDLLMEITIRSEIPAGSSTGTSGSLCVALLGLVDQLDGGSRSPHEIARLAHRVEAEKLKLQSGIQDQLCAAYGGISFIAMHAYPEAEVQTLALSSELEAALDRCLRLVYLGSSHNSTALHEEVIDRLESQGSGSEIIARLRALAEEGRDTLLNGDLEAYGRVMIKNNDCQRTLHPALVSATAEEVIDVAKKHDALGWKVNGAGGDGGSLTLLASTDPAAGEAMLTSIATLGRGIRTIPTTVSRTGLERWS